MKSIVIQYTHAKKWYSEFLKIFKFNEQKDYEARNLLFSFRNSFDLEKILQEIENKIKNKIPFFFGAGPNLFPDLQELLSLISSYREYIYIVSADGASNALFECDIVPDLIISDLDGLTFDQMKEFINYNVIFSIHAHGDNIQKILEFQVILETYKNIIGTTQVCAKYPIINPGGFTDGDRGVYLMHHLFSSNSLFLLIGYDFDDIIGKYSKPNFKDHQIINDFKRKKLLICQDLLNELMELYGRKIIFYKNHPKFDLRYVTSILKDQKYSII